MSAELNASNCPINLKAVSLGYAPCGNECVAFECGHIETGVFDNLYTLSTTEIATRPVVLREEKDMLAQIAEVKLSIFERR